MNSELSYLVNCLSDPVLSKGSVISWGSPVISFGNLSSSKIATLGLNPSNREFVDYNGKELDGIQRRFHTLSSLGISKWSAIREEHLLSIIELCQQYFFRNPYNEWFKKLDYIISGTSMSYYFPSGEACHLDIIPYATSCKWTELNVEQRSLLFKMADNTLGQLLKHSPVELIVLNGQTVVQSLEQLAGVRLTKRLMTSWTLPRKEGKGVSGYSYTGSISKIAGVQLSRKIKVLGYNHNIQSSFGVTKQVNTAIRNWISKESKLYFNETE
jgi:hypothetical protein